MSKVRVRYAPSPTGHLHIGNARTALYVYLFAKRYGGKMVLRIEDTDIARNVENGESSQIKYLNWLGIDWDEGPDKGGAYGPYRQLERLEIYQKYAQELIDKGMAYRCYCTEDELEKEREKQMGAGVVATMYSGHCRHLTAEQREVYEAEGRTSTIRALVPADKIYRWTDLVKGEISFASQDIADWVMMKNNGIPTYNFACVIDDHLMEISDVLRGEEHISNTPKQLMIYEAFGWNPPNFAHMSIIVNEQRKKLSKRDESVLQFIEQYADLGYLPEAMFNFIALLGFSPAGEEEIFSPKQFCELFDVHRLGTAPAMFDVQKLEWINNRYMKQATLAEVMELALPHLATAYDLGGKNPKWVEKVIALFHNQMSYGAEIVPLASLFFKEEFTVDADAKAFLQQEGIIETLQIFKENLTNLTTFDAETIKEALKQTGKAANAKGKLLFMPARIATTGQMHGPELPLTIELIGKPEVIGRIQSVLECLS